MFWWDEIYSRKIKLSRKAGYILCSKVSAHLIFAEETVQLFSGQQNINIGSRHPPRDSEKDKRQ